VAPDPLTGDGGRTDQVARGRASGGDRPRRLDRSAPAARIAARAGAPAAGCRRRPATGEGRRERTDQGSRGGGSRHRTGRPGTPEKGPPREAEASPVGAPERRRAGLDRGDRVSPGTSFARPSPASKSSSPPPSPAGRGGDSLTSGNGSGSGRIDLHGNSGIRPAGAARSLSDAASGTLFGPLNDACRRVPGVRSALTPL
jgi:hypothetical protein